VGVELRPGKLNLETVGARLQGLVEDAIGLEGDELVLLHVRGRDENCSKMMMVVVVINQDRGIR